jgi:Tol biopolymer transport system component
MSESSAPDAPRDLERPPDRLDSWKEIARYLRRDVTTVQRWEKREGMPVHRHVHDKMGSVYAYRGDLDAWAQGRNLGRGAESGRAPEEKDVSPAEPHRVHSAARSRWSRWLSAGAAVAIGAALMLWTLTKDGRGWTNPIADARTVQLTDFGGAERAGALSRDGRFAALLSDRDGRMDVWVTQVGTGRFYNLTGDAPRNLVNPSIREIGFSPDGSLVTFWLRRATGSSQQDISIWSAPVLGGRPKPYLEGVAEFDWSTDGRLVYHTAGSGDPMFVRAGRDAEARHIFSAPPGLHSHFPVWSPDQEFIYFVQGSLPDRLDIWRIRPSGGPPEQITRHNVLVSHPVFVDARTLMYLASDADGSGPWLHSVDVVERRPHRVSSGVDRYTSLGASADGRRLIATLARPTLAAPKGTLWRFPFDAASDMSAGRRISLTTGSGSSPRLGDGYLLYVSSKDGSDAIWRMQGSVATEVWSTPDSRITGGPAISRDGRRIVFAVKRSGQSLLCVANVDGTDARVIPTTFELQGAPAWTPDGTSITAAGVVDGTPRLFNVPLDGASPAPLLQEHSVDPAWSPAGDLVVFSGPDIGTTFVVKAITAKGGGHALPNLTLTRGARRVSFMPHGRSLVIMRGEIRHKNLWSIDLDTGTERQLTDLPADFDLRDFDISPDGRELVLEEVKERSDIVMLEIHRR